MVYFLNPRSFKIVTCPPPNLTQKKTTLPLKVIDRCSASMEHNFTDGDMMHALTCFFQWFLFTDPEGPKNPSQVGTLASPEWIQNLLKRVARGQSGSISVGRALRERFSIALKTGISDLSVADLLHEYVLATYATNRLRYLVPTFCYTLGIYKTPKSRKLILEKIPGGNFHQFVHSLLQQPVSKGHGWEFLSMVGQIALSLEIAQEAFFFTHYDLHAENIIIRKLPETLPYQNYPIINRVYQFKHLRNLPTFIDFAHSTAKYQKGYIGRWGPGSFPQYGMYPFYIPGADLFKLFSYLWLRLLSHHNFPPQVMGHRIKEFVHRVLLQFYRIQTNDPNSVDYVDPKILGSSFYNGTERSSIYLSPLDFINFCERDKKTLRIFDLQNYPWETFPIGPSYPWEETLTYRRDETYKCYRELFCHSIEPVPRDIFPPPQTEILPEISEKDIKELLSKSIPTMKRDHLRQIQEYLSPAGLWKKYTAFVEHCLALSRKGSKKIPNIFSTGMQKCLYVYRAHESLEGYLAFVKMTKI